MKNSELEDLMAYGFFLSNERNVSHDHNYNNIDMQYFNSFFEKNMARQQKKWN